MVLQKLYFFKSQNTSVLTYFGHSIFRATSTTTLPVKRHQLSQNVTLILESTQQLTNTTWVKGLTKAG
jgi:hypothetical protein